MEKTRWRLLIYNNQAIFKQILNFLRFLSNKMTSVEENGVIKEGLAEIVVKPGANVFYNPVQEFNRDLSVAVLRLCVRKFFTKSHEEKPEIRVLEALSATGLRGIRYAKEVPGLSEILANDLSKEAVENIDINIKHNNVGHLVKSCHFNATEIMFKNRRSFEVIDLDPYGCPSIFLDSAVQSVKDGGILLVTSTDMAVLCGNAPSTCYVKYGAISLRNKACHEMALRIVLQNIEAHANRYKRYIKPLLSISADFYVRVVVQIFSGAVHCKNTTSKLSMVFQCIGCEMLTLQPLGGIKHRQNMENKHFLPHAPTVSATCQHCQSKFHMGGPIWSAPIHDPEFVNELISTVVDSDLNTKVRLEGILQVIREELPDIPLYYVHDRLCSIVHANSMGMMIFRSALLNAGYRVSYSHANSKSIKTDAPANVLWDVIRSWVLKYPVSAKKQNTVSKNILAISPETNINFTTRQDANPLSRYMKLVRFQENPAPFWGPGTKAAINTKQNEKSIKNQDKTRKRRQKRLDSGEKPEKIQETNEIM